MNDIDINELLSTASKDSKIDDNLINQAKSGIKEAIAKIKKAFPEATAEQFKNATSEAIKQLVRDLSADNPDIKKAMATFAKSMHSSLKDVMGSVAVDMFVPEFVAKAKEKSAEAGSAISGAFKKVAEGAGIVVPVDFDITNVKSLKEMLTGAGGAAEDAAAVAGGFLLAEGFDKAEKVIAGVNTKATDLIGNLDDYRRTAGEISKIQINPFEGSGPGISNAAGAAGAEGARTFQKNFAKEAISLRFRFGISADDAQRELAAVYSGLENYGAQLEGIKLKAKIDGQEQVISGAEAIATAARATGIDISTMTGTINELTFTMGANGERAIRSIETIAKASANTLLPVKSFSREVMTAARHFSDFGDNTEESAAMLDRFISKADPNRIGASVKAFQSVASGIAGMADEMKAFIGMGTDLAGGGGAIESIVRLDAALQSGDKDALQGIFDEAISRIEELSGAPVMTLQEAVASGQENTFYQQVKMLEQMRLGSGSAQASDIFAASKRGAIDVEAIRAQGGAGLMATAAEKATFGRGASDILQQQAGAAADLARFNAAYSEGSVKVMDTSNMLSAGLLRLGGTVAGTASVMDALAKFGVKDFAITETSDAAGAAAVAEGIKNIQDTGSRESRGAMLDTQAAYRNEIQAALGKSQETVIEELTKVEGGVSNTVKAETDKVITALGGNATGAGAGQGDAAVAAELRKLIEELKNKTGQTVQIEFKGEAKELIKVIADSSAKAAVEGSSTGVRTR